MKKITFTVAFAAMTAFVCTAVHGDTFTWRSAAATINYRFQDDVNWEEGTAPAINGGHDIDMTADTAQLSGNRVGQVIEHITVPYGVSSFNSFTGRYGRWLKWVSGLQSPPPGCTIGTPNDFYGLFLMNSPWTVTLGATAGFTPVIQRFGQKGAVTFNVPTAGTSAVISNVVQSGVIGKTGSGRLTIVRPGGNTGGIRVKGGTVEVEGARRFSDAELEAVMAKAAFHVDASAAESVSINSSGRVANWYDVRGQTGYNYGRALTQNGYTLPLPRLAKGYQNGLDVMDFGPLAASYADAVASGESCTLYFPESFWNDKYFLEAFVVEGQHDDGVSKACFFGATNDKGFRRYKDSVLVTTDGNSDSVNASTRNLNSRDGDFAINGRKVLPTEVVTTSVMRVYSFRARENAYVRINCWGADYGSNPGGVRVGEALYFTNFLSYAERKNLIRHLSEKWGCADDGAEDAYDVGYMQDSTGSTTFDAPKDLKVREIAWSGAKFEKTGAGELETGIVRDSSTGVVKPVVVSGGTLKFGPLTRPSADPQPPADTYRHYDASDTASVTYADDGNGNLNISEWRDQSGDASKTAVRLPTSLPNGTHEFGHPRLKMGAANGRAVIDFGPFAAYSSASVTNSGAMRFDENSLNPGLESDRRLRTGFLVFRKYNSADSSIWILGSTRSSGVDFHPGSGGRLFNTGYAAPDMTGGDNTRDGLPFDADTVYSDWDKYHVVRISALGPLFANAFSLDRGSETLGSIGGFELAEVIFYSRPLSRQEAVDTEAYLMKKWLGKEHPNAQAVNAGSYAIGAAAAPEVDTAIDIVVTNLSVAAGTFTKKGTGRLSTDALSASVRSVDVQGGELVLPFDTVQPLYRIDASKADSLTTFTTEGAGGTVQTNIVTWADIRDNGVAANVYYDTYGVAVTNPTLVTVETRPGVMRPAVNFGLYRGNGISSSSDGTTGAMYFGRSFNNVREVFTVHADHKDAYPFLFCHSSAYNWHRNASSLFNANHSGLKNEPNAIIKVDGELGTCDTRLSSTTFYVVNVARDTDAKIDQISLDRRMSSSRAGGMYCCEQIAYPARLSDERRDFMNRHLMYKWFGEGVKPVWTNATLDSVSVAAGATLTIAPEDVLTLDSLSGAGRVKNGGVAFNAGATWSLPLATDVADAAHIDGTVSAAGALTLAVTLPDGFTVADGDWPLAQVGEFDIDFSQVALTLSRPVAKTVKLRLVGGTLYLSLAPRGTTILLR